MSDHSHRVDRKVIESVNRLQCGEINPIAKNKKLKSDSSLIAINTCS